MLRAKLWLYGIAHNRVLCVVCDWLLRDSRHHSELTLALVLGGFVKVWAGRRLAQCLALCCGRAWCLAFTARWQERHHSMEAAFCGQKVKGFHHSDACGSLRSCCRCSPERWRKLKSGSEDEERKERVERVEGFGAFYHQAALLLAVAKTSEDHDWWLYASVKAPGIGWVASETFMKLSCTCQCDYRHSLHQLFIVEPQRQA